MAFQRKIFAHITIIIIVFLSIANGLHEFAHQEYGYSFEAYPDSHIGTFRGKNFDKLVGLKRGFMNKFKRVGDSVRTLSVDDFGAKGDGSDDTKAFQRAWKQACSSSDAVNLVIPDDRSYLLKPIIFSGHCKSSVTLQILGSLEASEDRSDYGKNGRDDWLVFDSIQNLKVEGGGIINGNGFIWWQHSCKVNTALPCKDAPTALTFHRCKNLVVENLKIQDAQQIHVAFERCVNVEASNLMVTAPEDSPNTDGIHVSNTQNIAISTSTVGTGDDCISIVNGSQSVQATDIICGPGHGISVGSLGSKNSVAYVSDVVVNGARLIGTTNGVRIKTWQGGSGMAKNIKFQNIEMQNVKNPIIIDQNYCDQEKACQQQESAVQVMNVVYQNIWGTSASDVAIKFDCSKSFPCQGIVLQNVNLETADTVDSTTAVCNNVRLSNVDDVSPLCP